MSLNQAPGFTGAWGVDQIKKDERPLKFQDAEEPKGLCDLW